MADVRIGCRCCGKQVLMDVMRYDPENRKNLICPECFNHKIAKKDSNSRTRRLLVSMQKTRNDGTYLEFRCTNCKYEFMRKALARQSDVCPFCGKKTAVQKQKSGMDWVKDL